MADVSSVAVRDQRRLVGVFGLLRPVQVRERTEVAAALTPRQADVLNLLAAGASTSQIQETLQLSRETVRTTSSIFCVLSARIRGSKRSPSVAACRRLSPKPRALAGSRSRGSRACRRLTPPLPRTDLARNLDEGPAAGRTRRPRVGCSRSARIGRCTGTVTDVAGQCVRGDVFRVRRRGSRRSAVLPLMRACVRGASARHRAQAGDRAVRGPRRLHLPGGLRGSRTDASGPRPLL